MFGKHLKRNYLALSDLRWGNEIPTMRSILRFHLWWITPWLCLRIAPAWPLWTAGIVLVKYSEMHYHENGFQCSNLWKYRDNSIAEKLALLRLNKDQPLLQQRADWIGFNILFSLTQLYAVPILTIGPLLPPLGNLLQKTCKCKLFLCICTFRFHISRFNQLVITNNFKKLLILNVCRFSGHHFHKYNKTAICMSFTLY